LKLKRIEAKVKCWSGTHMTQRFLKKILIFKNFRREQTVFHFIFLKKMENLKRFFSIFEVRGGNFFSNVVWLKSDHFFLQNWEHFIFLLKLKILEAKVKFWCGTHMIQLFLKKFLSFTKF
jgi:DNA modification methylase